MSSSEDTSTKLDADQPAEIIYTVEINTLDDVNRCKETGHIYTEDKAPWRDIIGTLPAHQGKWT